MPKNILVVDDEKNIRDLIKFNLEKEQFQVVLAENGSDALEKLNENIDLVILDIMLPGIDGMEVCKKIRNNTQFQKIPVIMLTAKGEEIDKVLGLEIGADDYIVKPFSPRELIARIKAIFRRVEDKEEKKVNKKIIKSENLEINLDTHEVLKYGNKITLTPKEFQLLKLLLINKYNVLSREKLLKKIWGYNYDGNTRTVDVHIRRLRKKIGEEYIETVQGVGYKLAKVE